MITKLQPLEERRQLFRLTLFYMVVEGLAPALPPDKCMSQQKRGRLIRARQQPGYVTTNTIGDCIHKEQSQGLRNSTLLHKPTAELVLYQDSS